MNEPKWTRYDEYKYDEQIRKRDNSVTLLIFLFWLACLLAVINNG